MNQHLFFTKSPQEQNMILNEGVLVLRLFYTFPLSLLHYFLINLSIFLPYPIDIPPLYMIWDIGGTSMGQLWDN